MILFGYRVGPLLKKTGREIRDDGVSGLAAEMAYYFFFSLFPIFLFLAPLLSLIGDRQQLFSSVMGSLATVVPGTAFDLLRGVVAEVVFAEGAPGLMSVGLLLAAWAGSNVFNGLIIALNKAYDVTERRPFWKRRLIALGALTGSAVIVGLATVVMLGGEDIVRWLSTRLGIGDAGRLVWTVLQYPIAAALLVGLAWCIYFFLPNVRQEKRHVLAGAILATMLWIVVTLAFRFYVQSFGNYNKTYGTIGGVIVLLTWMYLSMLVILIGGELNAELHAGTGAVNPKRGILLGGRISTGTGPSSTSGTPERAERLVAGGPEQD
jgi:membrane protein